MYGVYEVVLVTYGKFGMPEVFKNLLEVFDNEKSAKKKAQELTIKNINRPFCYEVHKYNP